MCEIDDMRAQLIDMNKRLDHCMEMTKEINVALRRLQARLGL